MSSERVLLLDGHTTQALACARSLGRAGCDILVASTRHRPLAAWSRHCSAHFRLAGESPASFASLRDWARGREATLVLPLTERSHLLVNAERSDWQQVGIHVGCAPDALLRRAFDKARTITIAERCGVAVPPTRLPRSIAESRTAAEELGFPCVVKGRFSAAWDGQAIARDAGTSYVRSVAELDEAVQRHRQGEHWPVIQGFVAGQGKGVFTVCDHGTPRAWFAHERLRDVRPTGSGSSLRRSAILDPRLREPAERLLRTMGWHGPAMVEFRDDGVRPPWLMEVNGRLWGSLQLAISAGVDFPRLWLEVLRGAGGPGGRPVESSGPPVTLRWLWGDAKRLLYVMAGAPPGYPAPFPSRLQGLREVLGRQPEGTRSETWERADPWPAVGEWVQGIGELLTYRAAREPATARAVPGASSTHASMSRPDITSRPRRRGGQPA